MEDKMEILQRLSTIEERLHNHIQAGDESRALIQVTLNELKEDLTRYKGFAGGVAFVISAIFTVLMLVKEKIFS